MPAPDADLEMVRARVREASQLTRHPEARDRLREALAELAPDIGAPIVECPTCHRLMVRDRLELHDCHGGRR
jgi:hypothetical protein